MFFVYVSSFYDPCHDQRGFQWVLFLGSRRTPPQTSRPVRQRRRRHCPYFDVPPPWHRCQLSASAALVAEPSHCRPIHPPFRFRHFPIANNFACPPSFRRFRWFVLYFSQSRERNHANTTKLPFSHFRSPSFCPRFRICRNCQGVCNP